MSVVENTTAVTDVDATDPDAGDTLTYAIAGGADQALPDRRQHGNAHVQPPPGLRSPADADGDNVYEVDVSVGDGALNATQSLAVTVTDADETPANQPPAITSAAAATRPTRRRRERDCRRIVTATDPRARRSPIRSAAARTPPVCDRSASGALSFVIPPDYEDPADQNADNAYEVLVRASDGSLADVQSLVVRVGDVNDARRASSSPVSSRTRTSLSYCVRRAARRCRSPTPTAPQLPSAWLSR